MAESSGSVRAVKVWREAALRCRKLRRNLRQLSLCSASEQRLALPDNIGQVQILDLANNSLRELPDGLDASLTRLRALILRRNRLCRLPAPICALDQLAELDLAHNCLAQLPGELGRLQRLQKLCLSHNKLQLLPLQIGALHGLEELDISFNELSQLPPSFGQLQKLRTLDLDHNRLTTFPQQILRLGNLEELDFSGNKIEALPQDIMQLRSMKIMWLSSLRLSDLPDTFCQLTELESLMLDNNTLHSLPESFGRLDKLKMINLSSNLFENFPSALLELVNLEELYLSRNKLSVIPQKISNISKLATLWLDNNKVRYLPDSIVSLCHLEELVLQGNQIAILPDSFGKLSKVSLWKIKDNPLIQPPYEVCMKGIPYIAAYQKELALSQPALKPRLKLVLMGAKSSGKTSLRQCLVGSQPTPPTPAAHSNGIEMTQWVADAENNLTFIVYDLAGDPNYDSIRPFFLSPGALYVLVVSLKAYEPRRFYEQVGYYLHLLGARVPHGVVCVVGAQVDECSDREVEEKCLDIHQQIAVQEKRDVDCLQAVARKVDAALRQGQGSDLRATSPHAPFYGVSDKNLRRRKAHVQYLLNHRLQILSPVIPVSCRGHLAGIGRVKDKLLSVAEHREIFPNLHRVLPRSWQRLEELHFKPQELWLSWWDSARLGLQAGLTEDRLQSALSYLHESGKLLYFEDSLTLKECVFHNLTKLIDILNVFFQRDASLLLGKVLADTRLDELRVAQLQHFVEGFLLHGLLPLHVVRLLLKPHIQTQQDLHLILELLEKMGLCYCLNKPKVTPVNGATVWFKFPCYVKNEVPHAEAWINGFNLSGQPIAVEQLQVEYSFPFLFPPGLFARYSVQINSHIVHRSDGKYQIFAYRGKVPVVISYKPSESCLQADTLSIASHATLPNIWTAWQAIIPLVEELNMLLQEWPGLFFSVHVLCSKCLKRGSSNPHTFPGELLTQSRPEGVTEIICPKNGGELVDVALVYPPTPTVISPCCK
ncbi:malignant fibrous histiocytoma-amplified sequence 1 homolog isoform X4 [Hypanus sabinus]|uniref:malignant fibrous histiocytoma-amplified sequence 1 homolog isoform X4 n=3 Tax=Hypanus sabinus TaxID=79690 RepID=UPI0028C3E2C5|nr:malignant fibrous histiocytoma-amplified sequence 1 homolog isoform X4 [Hypanus sabinus]